jgi:hypothetical protein
MFKSQEIRDEFTSCATKLGLTLKDFLMKGEFDRQKVQIRKRIREKHPHIKSDDIYKCTRELQQKFTKEDEGKKRGHPHKNESNKTPITEKDELYSEFALLQESLELFKKARLMFEKATAMIEKKYGIPQGTIPMPVITQRESDVTILTHQEIGRVSPKSASDFIKGIRK